MSMKKAELKIDEKARRYAGIYASMIRSEYQRKRANAAITALFAYVSFLKKKSEKNLDIQNSMTIYRNPSLCEEFETADFYVNGRHIDVRVTLNSSSVLIPINHYDNGIVPDFYAAVKIDKELTQAAFIGLIDTSKFRPQPFDYYYYKAEASDFITNEEFLELIKTPKTVKFEEKDHEKFKDNYLGFIDNEIDRGLKIEILQHLFKCPDCRTEFCCFTGFEMVNCHAAAYSDLIEDKTLEIIGAQTPLDRDDAQADDMLNEAHYDDLNALNKAHEENKEPELVLIEENEPQEETAPGARETGGSENAHDTADNSDILDELFSHDNDISELSSKDLFTDKKPAAKAASTPEKENKPSEEEEGSVQKVIADFDEKGAPVYSYISGAEGGKQDIEADAPIELDDNPVDLNSTEGELDIMDQMFVDGAMDREVKEHEAVSYSGLIEKTNTAPENNSASEVQPEKDGAETNTEEENSSFFLTDEAAEASSAEEPEILDDESKDEEQPSSNEGSIELIEDDDKIEEAEISGGAEEAVSEESETASGGDVKPAEFEIELEDSESGDTQETDDDENKNEESRSDLSSESENSSVQMFDGYIESELAKINEEDDDEEDEEEEDYEDEEGDDEMNGDSKKSSFKKAAVILCMAAVLLGACGAGAYFYLKNKETYSEEAQVSQAEEDTAASDNDGSGGLLDDINEETADINETPASEDSAAKTLENEQISEKTQKTDEAADEKKAEKAAVKTDEIDETDAAKPDAAAKKKNAAEEITSKTEEAMQKEGIKKIHLESKEKAEKKAKEADASKEAAEPAEKDINKAITKALSKQHKPAAALREINWFCGSELAKDTAFKNYMQTLDSGLKLNLKYNLLDLEEAPPKNELTVKFAVDNNRVLKKVLITESSGSDAADKIVLQSIKETFEGEKSPILADSPLKADIYFFKVVIKL